MMDRDALLLRVAELTVPCTDDGARFVQTDRLERIRAALAGSPFRCLGDLPLAAIYCHRSFQPARPTVLVSNHIDSVYRRYFCASQGTEIKGTLDNSACNAVAVELMLADVLPVQTLVAFTGDEEEDAAGVDQTLSFLQEHQSIFWNLEVVIVLDVTEEFYETEHFTVENYFIERENQGSYLRFGRRREFKQYLIDMLGRKPALVKDSEPDESWQYEDHDLNCFLFGLPCRLLGADMHDDDGLAVLQDSLAVYAETLVRLTHAIDRDLANRAVGRTRRR
jgi:hypothetical protein